MLLGVRPLTRGWKRPSITNSNSFNLIADIGALNARHLFRALKWTRKPIVLSDRPVSGDTGDQLVILKI